MEEIDVWRTAHQLVKMFPEDAELVAARRADALLDQGDPDGFHAVNRVRRAISDLIRHSPRDGGPVN